MLAPGQDAGNPPELASDERLHAARRCARKVVNRRTRR